MTARKQQSTDTQKPAPPDPPDWDSKGLPPIPVTERCATHARPGRDPACAYRSDDPERCPRCHMPHEKCGGTHALHGRA